MTAVDDVERGTCELLPPLAAPASEPRRFVRGDWLRACALGVTLAIVIATCAPGGAPLGRTFALLVALALLQGAVLGILQYRALRRLLPRLASYAWTGMTAVASSSTGASAALAVAVWTRFERPDGSKLPFAAVLGLTMLGGAFVGVVFGVAQSFAMRRHVRRSSRFVWANVAAWAAATPLLALALAVSRVESPVWLILGFDAAVGLMAGSIVGSMTCAFFDELEPWVDERWSLRGKTCAVTGANRGIGFEVAKGLAQMGARVVLFCRGDDEAMGAVERIRASCPGADLLKIRLDLSRLASVRDAANELRARCGRLDVLVHNAGSVFATRTHTEDGFEATLAVDAIGPFLLTLSVLDLLETAHGRVIHVAGIYQRRGEVVLDDLMFDRRAYDWSSANSQAQLARVVIAAELARRCPGLLAVSVHPGAVWTSLPAAFAGTAVAKLRTLMRPFFVRAELGAQPILRLAAEPTPTVPSGTFINRFALTDDVPDALICEYFWMKCEALVEERGLAARKSVSERLRKQ